MIISALALAFPDEGAPASRKLGDKFFYLTLL